MAQEEYVLRKHTTKKGQGRQIEEIKVKVERSMGIPNREQVCRAMPEKPSNFVPCLIYLVHS